MPSFARNQFNELTRLIPDPDFVFLNYGHADEGESRSRGRAAKERLELASKQLLRRVIEGAQVRGKLVLEVGCGRGGNCRELSETFGAKKVTGLDLAEENVVFCSSVHPTIDFYRGDAMKLPFKARSFDLVLNLESSSWYPDFPGFLSECFRVLKPGGLLAYADLLRTWGLELRKAEFESAGFQLIRSRDLTRGVHRAMRQNAIAYRTYLKHFGSAASVRGFIRSWNEIASCLGEEICVYPAWIAKKRSRR